MLGAVGIEIGWQEQIFEWSMQAELDQEDAEREQAFIPDCCTGSEVYRWTTIGARCIELGRQKWMFDQNSPSVAEEGDLSVSSLLF